MTAFFHVSYRRVKQTTLAASIFGLSTISVRAVVITVIVAFLFAFLPTMNDQVS